MNSTDTATATTATTANHIAIKDCPTHKGKFNMNRVKKFLLNGKAGPRTTPAESKQKPKPEKSEKTEKAKETKSKEPSKPTTRGSAAKQFIILCDLKKKKRRGGNEPESDEEDDDDADDEDDENDEDDDEDDEEYDDEYDDEDDDEVTEDEDSSVSSVDTEELNEWMDEFTPEDHAAIERKVAKDKEYKELLAMGKKTKGQKMHKMVDDYRSALESELKKEMAKTKKTQEKYSRIFKRALKQKSTTTTNSDVDYFKEHYSKEEQYSLIKKAKELKQLTLQEKPQRIALIERDIPQIFKAHALNRLHTLRNMDPYDNEYNKIKNWVDTFMKIPFGNYVSLPVTIEDGPEKCSEFMENAVSILDKSVYGLNDAKMQIMQLLGQLISNPTSIGTAIAIHGDKGVGKTSIVKDGISKILNRPFTFIPLGGATDSSYLEGHSYTYEGSTWGKIVQILIDSKVMNPVIYFDELDKISETPKGEEIVSILTHLTDTTQNMEFHDKYFSDIHFDMSKCIFIFSYNDETKINPILRDRMYRIYAKGYDRKEKTVIARDYLLPKIRQEVNFNPDDIVLSDEAIGHVIEKYGGSEAGVRNLKRYLEIIHTKLNLCRLMKPGTKMFDNNTVIELSYPFNVTPEIINKLITQKDQQNNQFMHMMYL
jgi:ATP-dependent Lon protease